MPQPRQYHLHGRRRNGEPDRTAGHHRQSVDPDDPAIGVDQRPAGIAGGDRGVGLIPQTVLALIRQITPGAGDDADRHRTVEPPGRAHRHHEFALRRRFGSELRKRQRTGPFRQFEPQQRQIGILVAAEQFRIERPAVVELDPDVDGFVDHMIVGHHFTGSGNQHTAPGDRRRAAAAALQIVTDHPDVYQSGKNLVPGRTHHLLKSHLVARIGRFRRRRASGQQQHPEHREPHFIHLSPVLIWIDRHESDDWTPSSGVRVPPGRARKSDIDGNVRCGDGASGRPAGPHPGPPDSRAIMPPRPPAPEKLP
ncbi:hypothetical protein SDC9_67081 [bioreactor metagenome]|uniref:Uncharacterized protein n=1 Tax=bioreactor metagenome TaxID=1076179 RepID=A0A644XWL8_9ZZZZ